MRNNHYEYFSLFLSSLIYIVEEENLKKIIYLLIYFGCSGSSLPHGLFLWLRPVGATLLSGVRASRCSGFSCGALALGREGSVVAAPGLSSTGSIIVVHGLSCSAACGIFPDQGSNLSLLCWQVDSLPLSHQESPSYFFIFTTL